MKKRYAKSVITHIGNECIICVQFNKSLEAELKVQSCKLYNNKYMTAATQIINTEISAFIAAPVLKLLSRKVFFINRKDNRNC